MPLSGAEKTRRYRERLKKERPDEYKAQCSRNLQRLKSKRKKISDMTPLEAEQQREQWRQDRRKSDAKKKKEKLRTDTAAERVVTENDKKNERLLKMCKTLLRRCKNVTNVLKKLRTQKETYKKRYQRLKKKTAKEIKKMETTILKLKAREEMLELSLKKTYGDSKTHAEKGCLKKILKNSKNKTYVCKLMGLKTKPRSKKKKVRRAIIPEIKQFYLRDDVSRNTAGKKETRTKHKKKEQIRYLTDTLKNLYQKYKSNGGRYGFTTFYKNKPFYVLSPHLNSRNTCLCVKHSNIEFLHNTLLKNKVLQFDIKDLLKTVACDIKNYECMHNKCRDCKSKTPSFEDVDNDREVSWFRWETQKHTYTKKDGKESKDMVTKRTAKVIKTGNITELKSIFSKDLLAFKTHYFNMNHQQTQFQKIISQFSDNEVVIVADFSENYETKLCNEIQAMHFGASKRQITLHTGMIYWNNKCQSFCSIANANNHQPAAIWAHLAPVIKLIKKETPNTSIVHIYTDGPSSQYRQKNNFYLLGHFTEEYGFQYATWNYYESGHGKSVADGIGGSIKRTLDRKVTQGADVTSAENAYDILTRCMKSVEIFLIRDNAIDEIATILPSNVKPLKGTQKVHQVITLDKNMIKYRDISCFCQKGLCNCFSPQTHILLKKLIIADLHKEAHIYEGIKECVIAQDHCAVEDIDVSSLINEPLLHISENESEMIDEPLVSQDIPFIIIDTPQLWQNTISDHSDEILDTNVTMTRNARPSPKNDTVRQHSTDKPSLSSQNIFKRKPTTSKVSNDTKKFKPMVFEHCNICYSSILGQRIKCIACKKWTCDDCVTDMTAIVYICNKCFEGDSEE